jgi:hypothetical protein
MTESTNPDQHPDEDTRYAIARLLDDGGPDVTDREDGPTPEPASPGAAAIPAADSPSTTAD